MVFRIRFDRTGDGKIAFYTAFGEGTSSKRESKDRAEHMKKLGFIEHYRIVERRTRGNLRAIRHKFPLSRYKTQVQRGTSGKKMRYV